jgi:prephenate dehydratase
MECDYACLPVENSLGGSIHENYDLMLRYDLTIVGEHEFRVHHCLLAKPGVKREDIKYAISHPQALAQCDNFLRGLGITPVPTYDTAGSAKMIAEGKPLPKDCTPENTAAIASDLAGKTYGLDCLDKGIEDDDTNFTRFLLLARKGVSQFLAKKIPAKTSIVFTLPNTSGALYKALACFSLRDIDFSKIESRPTSASLLNYLKFRSQQKGRSARDKADLPRFRYCFYLDFLESELDENAQNAVSMTLSFCSYTTYVYLTLACLILLPAGSSQGASDFYQNSWFIPTEVSTGGPRFRRGRNAQDHGGRSIASEPRFTSKRLRGHATTQHWNSWFW